MWLAGLGRIGCFPVDQVDGMHDVAEQHIEPLPATLTNVGVVYTQGLFRSGDKTVAIIDENLLFGALDPEDRVSNLGAFSMWDLFRGEVESQMRVFTDGLLALESGGSAKEHLASTMRAAHSIKGAARIVHLDVAVTLAHSMEDCLVAAQEGALTLDPAAIDVLLSRRRPARAAFDLGGIGRSGLGGRAAFDSRPICEPTRRCASRQDCRARRRLRTAARQRGG